MEFPNIIIIILINLSITNKVQLNLLSIKIDNIRIKLKNKIWKNRVKARINYSELKGLYLNIYYIK